MAAGKTMRGAAVSLAVTATRLTTASTATGCVLPSEFHTRLRTSIPFARSIGIICAKVSGDLLVLNTTYSDSDVLKLKLGQKNNLMIKEPIMTFIDYHIQILKSAVEKGILKKDDPIIKEYVDKVTDYMFELTGSIFDRSKVHDEVHKAFADVLNFEF
ncbi:MAG: hypothetical protein IKH26_09900 [Bacteroidaceae bacterium]|nr:hypothetical protein [Bacteroidaceae bacterium]